VSPSDDPDDADGYRPIRRGRPRGPRRSRAERREELLDGAERAIRRIGPQASMEELAAEAGITKPILYSHFGDRAGLADALAERTADLLIATLGDSLRQAAKTGNPHDVVAMAFESFCSFIESEPSIYRFLVRTSLDEPNPVSARLVTQIASRISTQLGHGMRLAGVDSAPAEPWGFAIVGMGFVAAEWWLDRRTMSKEDLIGHLTELVWGGLAGAGLDRLLPLAADAEGAPSVPVPALDSLDEVERAGDDIPLG
jgi:AcrR family transcriptional regulator